MSYQPESAYDVQVALGNVEGWSKINKYGDALDCDTGVATDLWDGADAAATGPKVWVPPTVARIHDLASTSAADAAAGTGMQTCRVYGLTSWSTPEVSEVVSMVSGGNAPTSNAYVIIHRIQGLTFGSGGTNAGIVTATAQTDATVTAAIQTGEGQTLMAIYGVPSTQTIQVKYLEASVVSTGPAVEVTGRLLVRENADQATSGFITKDKKRFSDTKDWVRPYAIAKSFSGPCVVKLQVITSTINNEVAGGFDAYVVDNAA